MTMSVTLAGAVGGPPAGAAGHPYQEATFTLPTSVIKYYKSHESTLHR
jgi:hypothetical protein